MSTLLKTPSQRASFHFHIDAKQNRIGIESSQGNVHYYHLQSLHDLYDFLKKTPGSWVALGSCGEENIPAPGTVEAWARDMSNPINGYYGLTDNRRGRFASYIPSILEYLGFAEVEHNPRNNRMRAI